MTPEEYEEVTEIYDNTTDLLVLLTELNGKWVHVRNLINKHKYSDLTLFNNQHDTLDTLFSAEQQIRGMYNHYGKQLKKYKEESNV